MRYLVYLSHSLRSIYLETIYSIYSFYLHNDLSIKIVVYTDNVAFFKSYLDHFPNISYEQLTPEMISEMKGKLEFIHRAKVCVLRDVLTKREGSFFFVDSDTYFLQSLSDDFSNVENGCLYMHVYEKNLDRSSVYEPLMQKTIQLGKEEILLDQSIEIWNSGIVGMTDQGLPLVEKVLALTDVMLSVYQKHIIEQLAFSYIFQKHSPIQNVDAKVVHYWYVKEFRGHLEKIFESDAIRQPDNLMKIIRKVNPVNAILEKRRWKKKGLARLFQRIAGSKFTLRPLTNIDELLRE